MRNLLSRRTFATLVETVKPLKPTPRNKLVRVRFAPSPTGYLHLGGLRTALYNYLFAKSHGGQFVLRIEDTDQARVVPGALEQLERDLEWAGIPPDEGPSAEASYGPYIQSERVQLYKNQAQILINDGLAYHCFCSEKRLELLRKEALRLRQVPKYDNKCRSLSREEAEAKIAAGEPHCVRFKLNPLTEPIQDLVCTSNDYNPCDNEGDTVILKQDGFPTYHLANVVDDHMMVITHVLRGVEWYISTPKHVLLYKAFGWDPPKYAHLPLINNADGSKLSKRQGDIRIGSFKEKGIFPLALMNFITKAGGGFKNMDLDRIYSMDELKENFDLSLMHKSSCKLTDRLPEYNRLVLRQKLSSEENLKMMTTAVIKMVQECFPDTKDLDLNEKHIEKILSWSKERIYTLNELIEPSLAFLWVMPSQEVVLKSNIVTDHIDIVLNYIVSGSAESAEYNTEGLKTSLKQISEQNKLPFNKLMKTLRLVLSGLKEGPTVVEIMEILGRDCVIQRLERAISILNNANVKTQEIRKQ